MADAVNGAVAVLAVAAALARYARDVATESSRQAVHRLPFLGGGPVLRGMLSRPVAQAFAHPATAAVRTLAIAADRLVPEIAEMVLARLDVPALVHEYVDIDRLAAMLDVDAVVARVDLDAVLERVDLDAVVARVDIAAVLDRLDLDSIVERVDIARVIDRVDLDAVVDKVDLDRAVNRVDLDAVVGKVDLDAVVDKVDLDRAVDRVDVDRFLARTDLAGIARYVVEEIDLPGLLRASTSSVSAEMARSVRSQGADADRAVERVVDRLLHRQGRRGTADGQPMKKRERENGA
jgi:hypothetical protein